MSLRGIIISSSDTIGRSQTTRISNSLDSGGISKKEAQNMYDFFSSNSSSLQHAFPNHYEDREVCLKSSQPRAWHRVSLQNTLISSSHSCI